MDSPPPPPATPTTVPRRIRLRGRLIGMLTSLILFIMMTMGGTIYYIVHRAEVFNWQSHQGEAARNAGQTVAAFLQRAKDSLSLLDLLNLETLKSQPTIAQDLILKNDSLLEIVRIDARGNVVVNAYSGSEAVLGRLFTIPQSMWFKQARNGLAYYSNVQLSAVGQPYILLALPAGDGGVVAARLNMDVLGDVVADIHYGETGRSFVISSNGDIVAHTDQELVLKNATLAGSDLLPAVMAAHRHEWYGTYKNLQGIRVAGATAPVSGTDWIVFAEVSTVEAYRNSRDILSTILAGMLILTALSVIATNGFLESVVLKPIRHLQEGAERIGQGNLEARIHPKRNDEIGRVAAAFNSMAENLQEQTAQVIQRTHQLEAEVEVRKTIENQLIRSRQQLETRVTERTAELASMNEKLVALNQVNYTLIKLSNTEKIVETILIAVRQILETPIPVIALYQEESDQITFPIAPGRAITKDCEQLIRHVIQTRAALLLSRDVGEQLAGLGLGGHCLPPQSLLAAPMLAGDRAVGVILLANFDVAGKYTPLDQEICLNFGSLAAIAIENARLYTAAQKEIVDRTQAEMRTRAALNEREVLLKEVHHRVKNNLQVISSLLNLQAAQIPDPQITEVLRVSQSRVRSMALIHEKLYQSNDLSHIDFQGYLQSLVNSLAQTYLVKSRQVHVKVQCEAISLNIDTAIPCGLIVNELVTNSMKYAFPDDRAGQITVSFSEQLAGQYQLVIWDDGVGLPPGVDLTKSNTLGLKLVSSLVQQIDGELKMGADSGTRFEIHFQSS